MNELEDNASLFDEEELAAISKFLPHPLRPRIGDIILCRRIQEDSRGTTA